MVRKLTISYFEVAKDFLRKSMVSDLVTKVSPPVEFPLNDQQRKFMSEIQCFRWFKITPSTLKLQTCFGREKVMVSCGS